MTYETEDATILINLSAIAAVPDDDFNSRWAFNPSLYKVKINRSTGKFGEELVARLYGGSKENRDGYDVKIGEDKIEVKTSFLTRQNDFWVNQIYYEKDGCVKDWTHLVFVLIDLDAITVWECERPDPSLFKKSSSSNGLEWRGKTDALPDCFSLVATIPTHTEV